jgi:hypothetical protein
MITEAVRYAPNTNDASIIVFFLEVTRSLAILQVDKFFLSAIGLLIERLCKYQLG